MIADTLFQLPLPIIFSCVVYFLVGLQPVGEWPEIPHCHGQDKPCVGGCNTYTVNGDVSCNTCTSCFYCCRSAVSKFFIFMGFMILCSLSATSLAVAIGAWCKTTTMSLTVLPMVRQWHAPASVHVHIRPKTPPAGAPAADGLLCVPEPATSPHSASSVQALEVCRLFGGFFLAPANLPTYFAVSVLHVRQLPCRTRRERHPSNAPRSTGGDFLPAPSFGLLPPSLARAVAGCAVLCQVHI